MDGQAGDGPAATSALAILVVARYPITEASAGRVREVPEARRGGVESLGG